MLFARAVPTPQLRSYVVALATMACATLAAATADAILPHVPRGLADGQGALLPGRPFIVQQAVHQGSAGQPVTDPGFAAFAARTGGEWHATFDRRTGRPSMAWGSGVPWIPGAGNRLTWSAVTTTAQPPASDAETLAVLETLGRRFLADNPGIFRVPAGVTLRFDATSSTVADGLAQALFRVERGGIPVDGAFVFFRVSHGNLIQFGSVGLGDALTTLGVQPVVEPGDALAAAKTRLAAAFANPGLVVTPITELVDGGTLAIVPWAADPRSYQGPAGQGLSYRLAWTVAFRLPDAIETWWSAVDALTGEVIWLEDHNRYACPPPSVQTGRITGGVLLGPLETTTEVVRGMPNGLAVNGGSKDANYEGVYLYTPGQPASTGLNGTFFNMSCQGCTNPANATVTNGTGGGLALGTGGLNTNGNGTSTRPERDVFYHLNQTRTLVAKHLTDANVSGYLNRQAPATVNINDTCNAYWDGNGTNFFRQGGGCNNTGDIDDVVMHEWGHGLDQFTVQFGPDGAWGEGIADVSAFLNTHGSTLGPYFFVGDPNGIREADEALVPPPMTPANCGMFCSNDPRYTLGPFGYEIHCEGQIFTEAMWRLGKSLRAKYGAPTGWWVLERITYRAMMLGGGTSVPDQAESFYDALVAADDDNGNLADGVPDGAEINDAFIAHGIASTPRTTDSAECVPPGTPAVMLMSSRDPATALWQVQVSWGVIAGATRYEVYRNDQNGYGCDLPVGAVNAPGTQLVDTDLLDGVTYRYRVAAFTAGGCVSVGENQQQAAIPATVTLGLVSFAMDDSAGNANGAAEPGETITISVVIANTSSIDATNVVGTLSTAHPGVNITTDTEPFGDLATAATAPSPAPHYVVTLDRSLVKCGESIPFTLSLEADQGCSAAGFAVLVGKQLPFMALFSDDFETDTGWRVDPAGTDTATTGIWVREAPLMTAGGNQPGQDHTPNPGTTCWVTGNSPANLNNAGDDDVDGGCTSLQSRVYDCAGQSGLVLSYWRYYQIATSLDDQLLVEISNDGGTNWRQLESLRAPVQPFQQATFDLDTVLAGPANRVVLRVTACDTGNGSLIEALVDDVLIGRSGFDCVSPDPQPRLSLVNTIIGDSALFGSPNGNGNGAIDPGEIVRLPMDLGNVGNAPATNLQGTISILSGPPGLTVTDATAPWPDVADGGVARSVGAPAHFEISVPTTAPCGSAILLDLEVTYDGPTGSYLLSAQVPLVIGTLSEATLFSDDFEGGDNGWTHGTNQGNDDWQHGAPGGASATDPPTAHSGAQVWGTDLGAAPRNGNYERNVDSYLDSPSIDCTGQTGVRLGFWRWLAVQDAASDQATVRVNGTEIWRNPTGSNLDDSGTGWTYQEYDISALADNQPAVTIRFTMTANGGQQFGGWNIDDVRVFARTLNCNPVSNCMAVGVPGATGPALRATGKKSLTAAEFSWTGSAAPGTGEFFRFYRGTAPTALTTLLTTDPFLATSFDDTTATPAKLYFYRLVLANCNDAEGPPQP